MLLKCVGLCISTSTKLYQDAVKRNLSVDTVI